MGQLVRPVDVANQTFRVHGFLKFELPESALVKIWRTMGPEIEDDIQGFMHHVPAIFRIDGVQLLIGGHAAVAEADIQSPLGQIARRLAT
jgi:hypothetical protein